jgi:hypothetical protein
MDNVTIIPLRPPLRHPRHASEGQSDPKGVQIGQSNGSASKDFEVCRVTTCYHGGSFAS